MWSSTWQIISAVLYVMNLVVAIYAATTMILRKQDPVKTLSWLVVLILLPYLGIILYFFFGQSYRKRKIYSRKGVADYTLRKELSSSQVELFKRDPSLLGEELLPYKKMIFQNLRNSYTVVEHNTNIEFFFTGRSALDAMYKAIEEAKKHIHLQSYIFVDDATGKRFGDLLIKKAGEGVEVRIMYDGVGSISLKKEFLAPLKEAGIEILNFSPVRFLLPTSLLNYRNHRKILVIDGKTGFLGGVNIANRYYNGTAAGEWRDTHIKIVGESVFSLQASFLLDRYFVLNRKLRKWKKYYPTVDKTDIGKEQDNMRFFSQTITSGPDSDWASIMQCYFSAITGATRHIYIVTPYFTPNETILNAIKIAALGNIDVRIMLPEKSDTKIVHWSTMSYVSELLKAGVKIYLFKKGFNHSKVISIDGKISIVGSANMDTRSFEHNFEIMSVIYNKDCAEVIEKQFMKDFNLCRQITAGKWHKRNRSQKIKESFARLWSPLL
ncbi:MAG: cardiolipin synthase [Bacteroidales bacterium]